MRFFLSILGIRMRNYFAKLFRDATRKKYGWRSDLAVVSGESIQGNKAITLSMESFEVNTFIKDCNNVRSIAGNNALMRFGVVPGEASTVTLFFAPSAIWTLGLVETFRFLKDWRGQSMVDLSPDPVVVYKFF